MSRFDRQVNRHPANRPPQPPMAAPPTAGAVDLQQLKGGDKAAQRRVLQRALTEHGYLCSCGNRHTEGSILVMGYSLGQFPQMVQTPQGPALTMQDGCHMTQLQFCSRTCVNYLDVLKRGMDPPMDGMPRVTVRAIRPLVPVEWLDVPEEDLAPQPEPEP